jgi:hypothetical protein
MRYSPSVFVVHSASGSKSGVARSGSTQTLPASVENSRSGEVYALEAEYADCLFPLAAN